jgi:hypothetical protein
MLCSFTSKCGFVRSVKDCIFMCLQYDSCPHQRSAGTGVRQRDGDRVCSKHTDVNESETSSFACMPWKRPWQFGLVPAFLPDTVSYQDIFLYFTNNPNTFNIKYWISNLKMDPKSRDNKKATRRRDERTLACADAGRAPGSERIPECWRAGESG